jgi:multidrug efflux pump subunit AcrB
MVAKALTNILFTPEFNDAVAGFTSGFNDNKFNENEARKNFLKQMFTAKPRPDISEKNEAFAKEISNMPKVTGSFIPNTSEDVKASPEIYYKILNVTTPMPQYNLEITFDAGAFANNSIAGKDISKYIRKAVGGSSSNIEYNSKNNTYKITIGNIPYIPEEIAKIPEEISKTNENVLSDIIKQKSTHDRVNSAFSDLYSEYLSANIEQQLSTVKKLGRE